MPGERDEKLGPKRVGVNGDGSRPFEGAYTRSPSNAVKLTTIERGIFSHALGDEHKFVAEGRRNWPSRLKQCLEVCLDGFLKGKNCFPSILSPRCCESRSRLIARKHALIEHGDPSEDREG
jgi:hypothetical protein